MPTKERRRILVLDDSPLIVHAIEIVLDEAGYDVRGSTDLAVLGSLAAWHPDLILTDVNMPDISGVDLCRRLKASYDTAHVPVVLYSSMSDDALAELAHQCEADGFLSKSRGLEVLAQELTFLLDSFA